MFCNKGKRLCEHREGYYYLWNTEEATERSKYLLSGVTVREVAGKGIF